MKVNLIFNKTASGFCQAISNRDVELIWALFENRLMLLFSNVSPTSHPENIIHGDERSMLNDRQRKNGWVLIPLN